MNKVIGIAFCLLPFHFAVSLESWWDEWSEQLQRDVSHDTYLNLLLLSENKDSKINMETLDSFEQIFKAYDTDFVQRRASRRDAAAPLTNTTKEEPTIPDGSNRPNVHFYKWEDLNHWFSDWPTMYICLTQTSLARAGIATLRNYYNLRTLYAYDYEYELGYLVSEIIHHYTSLLELMNMIHSKYVKFRFRRVTSIEKEADLAPVRYMWYIYRQMADLAKKIILFSEMLYSLKEKHTNNIREHGLLSPFILYPLDQRENATFRELIRQELIKQVMERGKKGPPGPNSIYKGRLPDFLPADKAKRNKKIIHIAQKKRESAIATPVPVKESKKNSFHDFHYGWSIEESWAKVPEKAPTMLDWIANAFAWLG